MVCKLKITDLATWQLVSIGTLIVLISCVFYYWLVVDYIKPTNLSEFGELFGGLVSFFNGLAFAGVIGTLYYQRKDINLQLAEFKSQSKTFIEQSFQTRFFEWLKLHHEIVKGMDLRDPLNPSKVVSSGRDCFKTFYWKIRNEFFEQLKVASGFQNEGAEESSSDSHNRLINEASLNPSVNFKDILLRSYMKQFKNFQGDAGHYFRNLYRLVLFVHETELAKTEKLFYVKIIRAQLSSYELILLFYNCLCPIGNKFYPLVEHYALLKNMDSELLFYPAQRSYYFPAAYGG